MENSLKLLKSKWTFAIVCLVLFVGLFIPKSDLAVTRLEKEIWNLGHLFGFFIIWMFLVNLYPVFRPITLKRIGLIFLLTLIVSSAIELIQHYIGRSASVKDIGLNLAGTLMALSIIIFTNKPFRKHAYTFAGFCLVVACVFTWPSANLFIDEVYIVRQFPVLSDFSTPHEISRWQTRDAAIQIVKDKNTKGLLVELLPTGEYPSVALTSFGRSWEKYSKLVIELDNTMNSELSLTLRIHDEFHEQNGNRYSDRFNKTIKIQPGKRQLEIPIIDLYHAPEGRKMEVKKIQAIMLFAINLKQKQHFRITRVLLR